jgi:hypothetical protein
MATLINFAPGNILPAPCPQPLDKSSLEYFRLYGEGSAEAGFDYAQPPASVVSIFAGSACFINQIF